jgi:hypothetical protein
MRSAGAALMLLLAACSPEASEAPPPDDDSRIACALAAAGAFARDCWVEQHHRGAGLQLVVRHPDGAFRVFDVLTDGHGLATADGADAAQVSLADGGIEVAVDGDRYRFPATIAGDARR